MAAVGLKPERSSSIQESDESTSSNLATLSEFAFAMKAKLQNINENSYNNFVLRVGKRSLDLIKTLKQNCCSNNSFDLMVDRY